MGYTGGEDGIKTYIKEYGFSLNQADVLMQIATGQIKADPSRHKFIAPSWNDAYANKWSLCVFNNSINGENATVNDLNVPINVASVGVNILNKLLDGSKEKAVAMENKLTSIETGISTVETSTPVLQNTN